MILQVNIFFLWEQKSTQMKIISKNSLVDLAVTPMHLPMNHLRDITWVPCSFMMALLRTFSVWNDGKESIQTSSGCLGTVLYIAIDEGEYCWKGNQCSWLRIRFSQTRWLVQKTFYYAGFWHLHSTADLIPLKWIFQRFQIMLFLLSDEIF